MTAIGPADADARFVHGDHAVIARRGHRDLLAAPCGARRQIRLDKRGTRDVAPTTAAIRCPQNIPGSAWRSRGRREMDRVTRRFWAVTVGPLDRVPGTGPGMAAETDATLGTAATARFGDDPVTIAGQVLQARRACNSCSSMPVISLAKVAPRGGPLSQRITYRVASVTAPQDRARRLAVLRPSADGFDGGGMRWAGSQGTPSQPASPASRPQRVHRTRLPPGQRLLYCESHSREAPYQLSFWRPIDGRGERQFRPNSRPERQAAALYPGPTSGRGRARGPCGSATPCSRFRPAGYARATPAGGNSTMPWWARGRANCLTESEKRASPARARCTSLRGHVDGVADQGVAGPFRGTDVADDHVASIDADTDAGLYPKACLPVGREPAEAGRSFHGRRQIALPLASSAGQRQAETRHESVARHVEDRAAMVARDRREHREVLVEERHDIARAPAARQPR